MENPDGNIAKKLMAAQKSFKEMLRYFRVVTDRKLNPDIMRRQIDFIQHETRSDYTVVVVDSLHKLPFQDLSDRRTGIDSWLRHMESIRDEENVSFFLFQNCREVRVEVTAKSRIWAHLKNQEILNTVPTTQ